MPQKAKANARDVSMKRSAEQCRNPWNRKCKNTKIEVYIYHKGNRLPICGDCWSEIVEKDLMR